MRDLRQDISKLFDEYSHSVIYIRRDVLFRCECYSERSGESKADCPICFGTSYVVQIESLRTRRTISSVPETLVGLRQNTPIGSVTPKAYVYYLEHFSNPKEGDLLLEVEWEKDKPKRVIEKLVISATDPQKGYQGRVEFWQVYCRYNPKGGQDDAAISQY